MNTFSIDPRSKLLILLFCVIASTIAPNLYYVLGLVSLISLLALRAGKIRFACIGLLVYAVMIVFTFFTLNALTGTLRTSFVAFLGLFHKVYACGYFAGFVVSTTKVGEFLSAMSRMHAPKKLVIPLAILLRYLPTIREDWHYITDAMRMRQVYPGVKGFFLSPAMTVQCLYVPLMMAASKAADELSIASITRGIENPKPRTSVVSIGFGWEDGWIVLFFFLYLLFGLLLKGGLVF